MIHWMSDVMIFQGIVLILILDSTLELFCLLVIESPMHILGIQRYDSALCVLGLLIHQIWIEDNVHHFNLGFHRYFISIL